MTIPIMSWVDGFYNEFVSDVVFNPSPDVMIVTQLIGLLIVLDVCLTHTTFYIWNKRHPGSNTQDWEFNYVYQINWRLFGYFYGTLVATLIQAFFWAFAIYICQRNYPFFYFMVGTYTIILITHLANISAAFRPAKQSMLEPITDPNWV